MSTREQMVECRTPTPGKTSKRISRAKFDLLRSAILRVVPESPEGVAFRDLAELVAAELTPSELATLGSIHWYVTTVKLEMERRGELARVEGVHPQRLSRTT